MIISVCHLPFCTSRLNGQRSTPGSGIDLCDLVFSSSSACFPALKEYQSEKGVP